MHDISKLRFDALAAYCRSPFISLFATERRWLEFGGERVLGVLIFDTDGEYSVVLLARDLKERYRWVAITGYFETGDQAVADADRKAGEVLLDLDVSRDQGDEEGPAVDFFRLPRERSRLNPVFVRLAETEEFSAARGIIEPMMRWYEDADGNFVEQFQTSGFDARIWELYLFAALTEAGFTIDRSVSVPDFVAQGRLGQFSMEATTVNPTVGARGEPLAVPLPETAEQQLAYVREYLPIRFAGPLTAKLAKSYWEQPHVHGKPLAFAIQDFHAPMSMAWSRSGLPIYLYGHVHDYRREADGSLTILPQRVTTHRWGPKEVPSGFFMLPGAENVSAVVFNSSATISKFNRIGRMAGFGSSRVKLVQSGFAIDHDPNASEPKAFRRVVDDGYTESWVEGMDVYHNPHAKYRLDPAMIPGAAHYRLLSNGQIESTTPEWHPLASLTEVTIPNPARREI